MERTISPMKITIVSYNDCGGAGIAALRLHKALMKNGIDSSMLCLYKTTDTPNVYQFKKSIAIKIIEHLPIPYKQNKYKIYHKELSKHYVCTSFPEAIYDISTHPLIQQADIINLHWVGNMLDYSRFFQKVKKPIVWTLHDNNPFLGFAHYRKDREKNQQYKLLEEKVALIKSNAINSHPNVSVVNLCNWMKVASSQSATFSNCTHTIIPNSIDIKIFKVHNQKAIREDIGLPTNKPIILFVSQSVSNPWKGFDILQAALKQLKKECFLLVIGKQEKINFSSENCKSVGTINDEHLISQMYNAADVFVLPTLEDNLPNTMVESLCCGTPVISFSNGGMTDYIHNMKNGIIVKDETPQDLLNAINLFLDNIDSFDSRETISKENHKKFSPDIQAERYIKLYKSVLNL